MTLEFSYILLLNFKLTFYEYDLIGFLCNAQIIRINPVNMFLHHHSQFNFMIIINTLIFNQRPGARRMANHSRERPKRKHEAPPSGDVHCRPRVVQIVDILVPNFVSRALPKSPDHNTGDASGPEKFNEIYFLSKIKDLEKVNNQK